MGNPYEVSFEIRGPTALFTRPDAGAAFVSYPAPTYSACKGMFEAIARLKTAFIRPTKVEICAPICYHQYLCNYNGPLRKTDQIAKNSPYQLVATVLVNVKYRIYGQIEEASSPPTPVNHLHALQEIFVRRLESGQFFSPPFLGLKEFVASYAGMFQPETTVEKSINLTIPSMLHSVFDRPVNGKRSPRFVQNVEIREGVLNYAE